MAPCRDLEIANLVDISHCEPGRPGPELFLPGGATNTERLDRFSDWFGRHGVEVPLGISLCPKRSCAQARRPDYSVADRSTYITDGPGDIIGA